MLNKLKEINAIANKLWHEDAYDMTLTCYPEGWKLKVTHRYVNKTGGHPEATVYEKPVSEETADNVIAELKASFVARASQLADFRKHDCDEIYSKLQMATDKFTKRLFILEELKRIA